MEQNAFREQRERGSVELHVLFPEHPRYEMTFHWHDEIELITLHAGRFPISLDGEETVLRQGDTAFLPGGTVHGGIPEHCAYECVVADLRALTGGKTLLAGKNVSPVLSQGPCKKAADAVFTALHTPGPGREWAGKGALLEWVAAALQSGDYYLDDGRPVADRQTETLKNALRFLRGHYREPLSLEQIAKAAGLSPNYLCRFFRERTGQTPVEYLNRYRLEKACEALRESDLSVTEIALDCGFNDLSYFIHAFRKSKGVSPARYRKEPTRGPETNQTPDLS